MVALGSDVAARSPAFMGWMDWRDHAGEIRPAISAACVHVYVVGLFQVLFCGLLFHIVNTFRDIPNPTPPIHAKVDLWTTSAQRSTFHYWHAVSCRCCVNLFEVVAPASLVQIRLPLVCGAVAGRPRTRWRLCSAPNPASVELVCRYHMQRHLRRKRIKPVRSGNVAPPVY